MIFSSPPPRMKMAWVATIDSFPESIVGFSKGQKAHGYCRKRSNRGYQILHFHGRETADGQRLPAGFWRKISESLCLCGVLTAYSGNPFTAAPMANNAAIVLLYEKCMTKLGTSESVFARTVDKVNPTQRINTIPIQLPQSWLT